MTYATGGTGSSVSLLRCDIFDGEVFGIRTMVLECAVFCAVYLLACLLHVCGYVDVL